MTNAQGTRAQKVACSKVLECDNFRMVPRRRRNVKPDSPGQTRWRFPPEILETCERQCICKGRTVAGNMSKPQIDRVSYQHLLDREVDQGRSKLVNICQIVARTKAIETRATQPGRRHAQLQIQFQSCEQQISLAVRLIEKQHTIRLLEHPLDTLARGFESALVTPYSICYGYWEQFNTPGSASCSQVVNRLRARRETQSQGSGNRHLPCSQ